MGQQNINFSGVPIRLILRPLVHPDPKPRTGQQFHQPVPLMLKPVKHQRMLPMQLFHNFLKCFKLAIVDFHDSLILIVDRPAAQLQQLPI